MGHSAEALNQGTLGDVPTTASQTAATTRTTTILASNIHCATCVNHIKNALDRFGTDIFEVNVRIVGDEVTIVHSSRLSSKTLAKVIGDEAFDVYSATTVDQNGQILFQCRYDTDVEAWFDVPVGRWVSSPLQDHDEPRRRPNPLRAVTDLRRQAPTHSKEIKHIENCAACRTQTVADSKEPAPFNRDSNTPRLPKSKPAPNKVERLAEREAEDNYDGTAVLSHDLPDTNRAEVSTSASNDIKPVRPASPKMDAEVAQSAGTWKLTLAIGGMTCSSCTNAATDALKRVDGVEEVQVDLLTNSGRVKFFGDAQLSQKVVEAVEDVGFDASVIELESLSAGIVSHPEPVEEKLYRATLSISGMTCAACSSAIIRGLEELPSVRKADIAVLTHSGDILYVGKPNIDRITEKIDDLGYDVTVESINEESPEQPEHCSSSRTVQIKVDGMFCGHCPARLIDILNDRFGAALNVEKPPSMKAPILTITYQPRLPDFTIRDILSAIDGGERDWKASIYHPPSLEERSKQMQLHERNKILRSLLIAFVVAIPTFIIGIVFMDLLPSSNPLQQFFMEPTWAGNVQRADWAMLILATPVYFLAADIFHLRAIKEIKALWRPGSKVPILRRFYRFGSMNLLISAGTSVAYIASVALIIVEATGSAGGSTSTTYFDSVVFLTFFILIGRYLEALSKSKTGDAVSMLGQLRPDKAVLVLPEQDIASETSVDATGPKTRTVEADLLEIGDNVIVAHGSSPPADGIIIWGQGKFDESSLTGESKPVSKSIGESIYVGTVNTGNPVSMEVTGIGGSSMLDQIVSVVREGLSKRAPVERLADVITGYFVPIISLLAVLTFVIWISLGYSGALSPRYLGNQAGGWAFWSLGFAISVFVAACPCGIGLAAPTALFVGIGLAAKHGILVRGGGQAFQDAPDLDAVVFDKTGTLTEGGDLRVTGHETLVLDDDQVKVANTIARRLEEQSTHPIAVSIVDFLSAKSSVPLEAGDFTEVPGRGIRGAFTRAVSGGPPVTYEAAIGSPAFITSLRADLLAEGRSASHTLAAWQADAKSVAVLALRRTAPEPEPWTLASLFGTSDPVRPSAAPTIKALQARGLQVFMLSGDNQATAAAVAATIGIPAANVFAGVLPHEKADKIRELQNTLPRGSTSPSLWNRLSLSRVFHHRTAKAAAGSDAEKANSEASPPQARVAFVGDGINDAPALTAATVSISLASGSSVALAAASFVLLHPSLDGVARLLGLSARVMRRVRMNYGWALVYNVVLVPVAAGVLFKVKEDGWYLGPVWAALAMAGSSVSVVLSSLALRWEGWRR